MSARRMFGMIQNVSGILRELESAGMRIEIGDDFFQISIVPQRTERSLGDVPDV